MMRLIVAAVLSGCLLSGCSGESLLTVTEPAIPSPRPVAGLTEPTGCAGGELSAADLVYAGVNRRATPTLADVPYADVSPTQRLDLYVPAGPGPFPLIIRIHGGAFAGGGKVMDAGEVRTILAAGFALASIDYRLSCEALFPAAPQDVFAATRFLRANADEYRLDPTRFASWGDSAGANLAALVGVAGGRESFLDDPDLGNPSTSSAVQAVVGWSGIYDMLPIDAQFDARTPEACDGAVPDYDSASSPLSAYLGAPLQSVPDRANAASPGSTYPYVGRWVNLPPMLLVTGDEDCVVPYQQSVDFARLLRRSGGASELVTVQGADHISPEFRERGTEPALAWLTKVLGPWPGLRLDLG
jgi:acetyl esterase/lipase